MKLFIIVGLPFSIRSFSLLFAKIFHILKHISEKHQKGFQNGFC
jgi:hypothetical protein